MLAYLLLASFFVLTEFGAAYWDGYAFAWQVRATTKHPAKYLDFWRHGGMWGDFFLINPIVAHILHAHSYTWSLIIFAVVLTTAAFAGIFLQIPILHDSQSTPSAFARDGRLTMVGGMHYLYFAVSITIICMFYLFTQNSNITNAEIVIVTICLILHLALGVLQPAWVVHGFIHLPGKLIAGGGSLLLVLFAIRIMQFK
jgi:hypothetical protein